MFKAHSFLAFYTELDPANDNTAVSNLFEPITSYLEIGKGEPICPYRPKDHNDFQKYAAIRSINKYGCQYPVIVWVSYNKHGETNYNISPGSTRYRFWQAMQTWKLPLVIIDMTCEADLTKHFTNLELYTNPVTLVSETFLNGQSPLKGYVTPEREHKYSHGGHNFHKLTWVDTDTQENYIEAEYRLQHSQTVKHFWSDYQHLQNTLPQLKVFLDGEQVVVWGDADNGIVETTISTMSDAAKVWLNHLQISC